MSSDEIKLQILNLDQFGDELYQKFVNERLMSTTNVWDKMKLAKLKTMSTWTKKISVNVGDTVVKFREEMQLLA